MSSPKTLLSKISLVLRYRRNYSLLETNLQLINFLQNNKKFLDNYTTEFTSDEIEWVEETIDRHLQHGVHIISILDPMYPYILKVIPKPPSVLFLRGNIEILSNLQSVSVVGAREATENGKKIAHRIAGYLSSYGWCITSGLAKGIDVAAHEGALDSNGKTIAVLAHGLEKAQPKQNENLAMQILEKGGAWISEHPIGVHAKKSHFIDRNRLQIGISAGSIIVEAGLQSGSATQARFCREQDRPLFAVVPETVENKLGLFSEGTIEFVNSKDAQPIRSKDDYTCLITSLEKSLSRLQNLERK